MLLENPFLSFTLLYNPSGQVMSVEKGSHYIFSLEQYAVIRRLGTLSKENRIKISCWLWEKRMSRLISLVNNEKNLWYKNCEMFWNIPASLFVKDLMTFSLLRLRIEGLSLFLWVKQKLPKVAGLEKVMSYWVQIIELPKSHTSPLDLAYVRWEVQMF